MIIVILRILNPETRNCWPKKKKNQKWCNFGKNLVTAKVFSKCGTILNRNQHPHPKSKAHIQRNSGKLFGLPKKIRNLEGGDISGSLFSWIMMVQNSSHYYNMKVSWKKVSILSFIQADSYYVNQNNCCNVPEWSRIDQKRMLSHIVCFFAAFGQCFFAALYENNFSK